MQLHWGTFFMVLGGFFVAPAIFAFVGASMRFWPYSVPITLFAAAAIVTALAVLVGL